MDVPIINLANLTLVSGIIQNIRCEVIAKSSSFCINAKAQIYVIV